MLLRQGIDRREKMAPINWLSGTAVLNTLLGMILIITARPKDSRPVDIFAGCIYILTNFGRQTIVLLLLLYEMAKVNAINDQMIAYLARNLWPQEEWGARQNLYLLLKECPLGSSIFFFRPSKAALTFQMTSTVLGVVAAVFWAFTFR